MTEQEKVKLAEEATKILTDRGLIVEAGWVGFKLACKLQDAPQQELIERRKTFFAGAMHLFSSMMAVLEEGQEPTEKDMQRLENISRELKQFQKEMAKHIRNLASHN